MSGSLLEIRTTHSWMEKPLANAVRVVLALVLVAPLIVMADPLPSTMFPYVVGKAVYTRLLVELAFALWLVLVLWHPAYRLPKSRLVLVLAVYVAVVLVASFTGVSLQRSLWSTYERMQGWVGLLHYAAFTVMLASMFRTFRDWRLVLNVNLAVGLVMGLLGVSQMAGLDLLAYLVDAPRISITLGNATYVGAYMLVNALIAAALLAHSLAAPRAGGDGSAGRARRGSRRGRRQRAEPQRPAWASPETLMRVFWVSVILLDLLMLYQSGTRGAIVGLAAGAGHIRRQATSCGASSGPSGPPPSPSPWRAWCSSRRSSSSGTPLRSRASPSRASRCSGSPASVLRTGRCAPGGLRR